MTKEQEMDLVVRWLTLALPGFEGRANPDYDPEAAQKLHAKHREVFDSILPLNSDFYALTKVDVEPEVPVCLAS